MRLCRDCGDFLHQPFSPFSDSAFGSFRNRGDLIVEGLNFGLGSLAALLCLLLGLSHDLICHAMAAHSFARWDFHYLASRTDAHLRKRSLSADSCQR
jgi:hypothetical protein